MTNEEKAYELATKYASYDDTFQDCFDTAIDMAAWKEQQMIEKAKEFISTWFYEHPHASWLICSDEFQDLDDCLERLEKEMKEENNND